MSNKHEQALFVLTGHGGGKANILSGRSLKVRKWLSAAPIFSAAIAKGVDIGLGSGVRTFAAKHYFGSLEDPTKSKKIQNKSPE